MEYLLCLIWINTMTEVICPTCGRTDFESEQGMKNHHAYSHDESLNADDRPDTEDCPTCDDSFPTERGMRSHHARVHGESLVCEDMNCEECGNSFTYYPRKHPNRQYCSDKCKDIGMADESNQAWRNTQLWQDNKQDVKKRDDYTCQMCGNRGGELHTHHITPVCVGGRKFDPLNLTTLCANCHDEAHDALNYPDGKTEEAQELKEKIETMRINT